MVSWIRRVVAVVRVLVVVADDDYDDDPRFS